MEMGGSIGVSRQMGGVEVPTEGWAEQGCSRIIQGIQELVPMSVG